MSATQHGRCRCGAIRYEIAAEPMFAGQCQCLDCQHESGGGHSSFVAFPAGAVKLTGTPRFYEAKAENGNTVRRGFCPTCGSPVVSATSGLPDVTMVSAGSLEDPRIFRPQFVCYTSRGHVVGFDRPGPAELPEDAADAGRINQRTRLRPISSGVVATLAARRNRCPADARAGTGETVACRRSARSCGSTIRPRRP